MRQRIVHLYHLRTTSAIPCAYRIPKTVHMDMGRYLSAGPISSRGKASLPINNGRWQKRRPLQHGGRPHVVLLVIKTEPHHNMGKGLPPHGYRSTDPWHVRKPVHMGLNMWPCGGVRTCTSTGTGTCAVNRSPAEAPALNAATTGSTLPRFSGTRASSAPTVPVFNCRHLALPMTDKGQHLSICFCSWPGFRVCSSTSVGSA
jgi:hypothetical protein